MTDAEALDQLNTWCDQKKTRSASCRRSTFKAKAEWVIELWRTNARGADSAMGNDRDFAKAVEMAFERAARQRVG